EIDDEESAFVRRIQPVLWRGRACHRQFRAHWGTRRRTGARRDPRAAAYRASRPTPRVGNVDLYCFRRGFVWGILLPASRGSAVRIDPPPAPVKASSVLTSPAA